jgi:hypothetical protein
MVLDSNKKLPGREMPLTTTMPSLDYKALSKVCSMKETAIAKRYGLQYVYTPDGGYWFKDNGSDILAVAHLDSCYPYMHWDIARLRHDTLIFCSNLDDRLGAYLLLEYLQKAGLQYDILLTTNEEKGKSTARHFRTNKNYNWMFMFDRAGTGSVIYNYRGDEWELALRDAGLDPTAGVYSCIKDLEFLGCKGVNIGTGYHNNHHPEAFARRSEIMQQLRHFLTFYEENANIPYAHKYIPPTNYSRNSKPKYSKTYPISYPSKTDAIKALARERQETKEMKATIAESALKRAIGTTYAETKEFLQKDLTELRLPLTTEAKLINEGIWYIGELAEKSHVDLLNIQRMNQFDIKFIKEALALKDISLSTNLKEYNLTFSQFLPPEEKVGEPQKEVKIFHLPATTKEEKKEIVQIIKEPISVDKSKLKPVGTGKISFSMPLMKGDNAKLISDKKGDTKWTIPLKQEEVGFQSSKKVISV